MPTIGWFEILIVVAIAIVVLGPKDFPVMLTRLQGASPRDAAAFANRAAAKIITQFGARLPSIDDYKRLMT